MTFCLSSLVVVFCLFVFIFLQTRSPSDQTTKYTITDAETGHEYEVQVRAKEEYDGSWSKWSAPAYGTSWTGKRQQQIL